MEFSLPDDHVKRVPPGEGSWANMRIGLALSGGAARGIAHVGVLSILSEAGVAIDCVAGASAGALIGAFYCAGVPLEQIRALGPKVNWRVLSSPARPGLGLVSFDRLQRWITMMLGDIDFGDLKKPLAVVAMDVNSGERIVLRDGRLAPAVVASCAVPGIVMPVEVDGRLLGDGGVVDNLPVDAARELGADYVIGVDVVGPPCARRWGPLGQGLAAIETLVRHAGQGVGKADFLIVPRLTGLSYLRFSQYRELITLGEEATRAALPNLSQAIAA